jgi:drug/metabolite transporter (DMT)-like permease
MTALLLILSSAITHAIVNVLTKRADDKYAMRLLIGVFSGVAVIPFLFLLPVPRGLALACLAGTAFVHAFYELLLVKSYETSAFSAVYPIARGTGPLFTAIGAMFVLHEHPPGAQLLGIALVCGGVIAIGISHRASAGIGKGIGYAVATGFTIGCYTLIDATGVRSVPVALSYILWFFVAMGSLC